MTEEDQKQRLSQLEARIATVKKAQEPAERVDRGFSHGELAWRMVIEMTAGIGIGFGIGYGLEYLFGTIPIFLVLFTLLGLAAGIKTMMRSAKEVQDKALAAEQKTGAEKNERD